MTGRRAITLLLSLALTGAAIYFAPVQAGGQSSFSVVDGISMNPKLHAGDLVVSRTASTYRVGDAVLYQNQILHRDVLHRILKIQGDRYYFKGDNNDFVDPGYATRDQLVGKLWFSVPNAGAALTWIGKPLHSGLIAAVVTLLLLLGTGRATKRRKRRRASAAAPSPLRRFFHRPRRTIENGVFLGAGLLACLVAAVGFTTPLHRTTSIPGAYTQHGSFSYSGVSATPSDVYPLGEVQTGNTIFLDRIGRLNVLFGYRFDSRLAHHIKGRVTIRTIISSDAINWQRVVAIHAASFTGDAVVVANSLDLPYIQRLADKLVASSGVVGADYSLTVEPVVHIHGLVGTKVVNETFAPTLPMSMTASLLKIIPPAETTLPGASYTTPSAASLLKAALNPTETGSLPGTTANTVTVLRYRAPVSDLRGLAVGLAALALLALLLKPLRPKREIWAHEKRIAHRHGCIVVPVAEIVASPGTAIVTVTRFEDLASLAGQQDEPIMLALTDELSSYAVAHGSHLYVFETPVVVAPEAPEAPVARPARKRRGQPRSHRFVHSLGVLASLALIASLGLVFTATTTVPASNAGVSVEPATVDQLAPAACSGLSLTGVVYVKVNTFSNSTSHVLIVGRSADDKVTDTGTGNCIFGGSGQDNVNAQAGSVCITNTTAKSVYKGCTKS